MFKLWKPISNHFTILVIITTLLVCGYVTKNFANPAYQTISTYFIVCDSLLDNLSNRLAPIADLELTDKLLLAQIKSFPDFEYLLRTNSKGKIISKVANNQIQPRDFRNIGRQTWFKVLKMTKKPSYDKIMQKQGIFLFWVKPVIQNKRLTGTLVAKINLKKSFSRIALENKIRFRVMYKRKNIFSNFKKKISSSLANEKLSIYGIPGLLVQYQSINKITELAMGKQTENLANNQTDRSENRKNSPPLLAHSSPPKSIGLLAFSIVFIGCLITVVVCYLLIFKVIGKNAKVLGVLTKS